MNTARIIRAVESASKSLRLRPGADRDDLEQDAAVAVIMCETEKRTDGYLFMVARDRMLYSLSLPNRRSAAIVMGMIRTKPRSTFQRIDELGERWRAAVREECAREAGADWGRFGGLLLDEEGPADVAARLGVRAM